MDMLPSTKIYITHSSWTDLPHGPVTLRMPGYILSTPWDCPFVDPEKSFYHELPSVFHLSCEDTLTYETGVLISTTILFLIPFSVFLGTYTLILVLICKQFLLSAEKAFSTCSSHLTVVNLWCQHFYVHFPNSSLILGQDKVVVYLLHHLIPMLNPMIYSLSNKDAMGALKKKCY